MIDNILWAREPDWEGLLVQAFDYLRQHYPNSVWLLWGRRWYRLALIADGWVFGCPAQPGLQVPKPHHHAKDCVCQAVPEAQMLDNLRGHVGLFANSENAATALAA